MVKSLEICYRKPRKVSPILFCHASVGGLTDRYIVADVYLEQSSWRRLNDDGLRRQVVVALPVVVVEVGRRRTCRCHDDQRHRDDDDDDDDRASLTTAVVTSRVLAGHCGPRATRREREGGRERGEEKRGEF